MSDKVRHRMEQSLLRNLNLQLERRGMQIKQYKVEFGRILLDMGYLNSVSRDQLIQIFFHVPGLISISPALQCEKEMNQVAEMVGSYTNKFLKPNQSFGIKVKGKTAPFRPQDYTAACNRLIITSDHPVNLHAPDLRIFVEIREKDVYCYSLILPTPWGGLPIEHEQAIIAQLLGEPTDLVASIRLLRRGCVIFPVIYNSTAQNEGENKIQKRVFENILESLTEYYPFDRIYGLKLDLDLIHKRLQTILDRTWPEIRSQLSPNTEAFAKSLRQHIFCMLCRRIRYLVLQFLLDYQKSIQENIFIQEEGDVIGSNLFLPMSRNDQNTLQKTWLNLSATDSEIRNQIKSVQKYRMLFNGIVSGEHPLMACPLSGPWLQVTDDIHYPVFYGAIALDKTILLHDLNLITPDVKWKGSETQSLVPISICTHIPQEHDFITTITDHIKNSVQKAWMIAKDKVNLIKMIPSIVEEAEIVVWTPKWKKKEHHK